MIHWLVIEMCDLYILHRKPMGLPRVNTPLCKRQFADFIVTVPILYAFSQKAQFCDEHFVHPYAT